MSPTGYPLGAEVIAAAREMYAEGWRQSEIGHMLGVPASTLAKHLADVECVRPRFRILLDAEENCWRIWERDPEWRVSNEDPGFHPLLWMNFATAEAAESFLEIHDLPEYGNAA